LEVWYPGLGYRESPRYIAGSSFGATHWTGYFAEKRFKGIFEGITYQEGVHKQTVRRRQLGR